jgi:hypothetical protein
MPAEEDSVARMRRVLALRAMLATGMSQREIASAGRQTAGGQPAGQGNDECRRCRRGDPARGRGSRVARRRPVYGYS